MDEAIDPISQAFRHGLRLCKVTKPTDCRDSPGKRPVAKNWSDNPISEVEARAWVAQGGNLGVICGNGLMVVDIDGEWPLGELPDTVTVRTGRGGFHLYYRVPDGVRFEHASKVGHVATGVDIRHTRTLAVYPPSVHAVSGKQYKFIPGKSLDEIPIADLPEWIIEKLQKPQREHPTAKMLPQGKTNSRYLDSALEKACDAVRNAPQGNGNERLNIEAYSIGGLLYSGHWNEDEVAKALFDAATADGRRSAAETRNTIASGLAAGKTRPREIPDQTTRTKGVPRSSGPITPAGDSIVNSEIPEKSTVDSATPVTLARAYHQARHFIGTVRCFKKTMYVYTGTHFAPLLNDDHLRADISRYLQTLSFGVGDQTKPIHPLIRRNLISDVIEQLKAVPGVLLPENQAVPSWLGETQAERKPASEFVSMNNGLLHLPSRTMIEHDPTYFCTTSLPFGYDGEAACPKVWLDFLESSLPGDDGYKAILMLQEFFGYCLIPETRHDKLLWLIGETRSGKGTILRTLAQLVGTENVATPTIGTLSTQFGLEPLLNKRLALTGDARFPQRYNSVLMERLLSLTGNDALDVDRKGIPMLHGVRLGLKLVMASNKPPDLLDTAGALAARVLAIDFPVSFLGREDRTLSDRINECIPGIFNWALDGYDRLREQGEFTQVESKALARFRSESSPLGTFVAECCNLDPAATVATASLYEEYRRWCETNDRETPGDDSWFGKQLQDNHPGVARKRASKPDDHGKRGYYYLGIATK